jgi:hypothetical protein
MEKDRIKDPFMIKRLFGKAARFPKSPARGIS